jgi:hypothetical protein
MSKAGRLADLSDEASVFFNESGRRNSVVGAVAHNRPRLGAI